MTDKSLADQPRWQRILLALVRLIVLGGVLFYFMGWSEARHEQFHDRPLLGIPVQIGLGLIAIAVYIAFARVIERRKATELDTPGLGREWAIGALCGAGLYTASAVTLMLLGSTRLKGSIRYRSFFPRLPWPSSPAFSKS